MSSIDEFLKEKPTVAEILRHIEQEAQRRAAKIQSKSGKSL